ncbi:hypothetical protein H8957_016660, partial [Semnopithecus entellus]
DKDERIIPVDDKCKWAQVIFIIISSTKDPNEDTVERNIQIAVLLDNKKNISDPVSRLRTKFVYHLSYLCKKCDPTSPATQSSICDKERATEICHTGVRNECSATMVPLIYGGETKMVKIGLTPGSCYPD